MFFIFLSIILFLIIVLLILIIRNLNKPKRFNEYINELNNKIKDIHIKPIDDNLFNESLKYLNEVIKSKEYIGYRKEDLKYIYKSYLNEKVLSNDFMKHLLIGICKNIATMKRIKTKLGKNLPKEQLENYNIFCREWINYQDTIYLLDQIE